MTSSFWVVVSSCDRVQLGQLEEQSVFPTPSSGDEESALADLGSVAASAAMLTKNIRITGRATLARRKCIKIFMPAPAYKPRVYKCTHCSTVSANTETIFGLP